MSEKEFRASHEGLGINCDFSDVSRPPAAKTWQRVVIDAAIDLIREMFGVETAMTLDDGGELSLSDQKTPQNRATSKHSGFELFCLDSRLRVIPLAPRLDKALHEYPFACVVSQAPGEQMYNTTKPCLHVFCCEDDEPDFADGMYASDKETVFVGGSVDWPVLSAALSKEVKAYSTSLKPKDDELPFQRVMLWHDYGHMSPRLDEDAEGHALRALAAASKWNRWLEQAEAGDKADKKFMKSREARATRQGRAKKWGFDDAMNDLCTPLEWAKLKRAGAQFAAGERLRKFCESVGLRRPERTDFKKPYNQLLDVLKEALQVHEGIRDEWTKSGRT